VKGKKKRNSSGGKVQREKKRRKEKYEKRRHTGVMPERAKKKGKGAEEAMLCLCCV
jgi:hypothetical protein